MMEGDMVKVELRWLVKDKDRHGNIRRYVRVPGKRKIRLRAEFGTEEFLDAYRDALEGRSRDETPKLQRVSEGSFEGHCRSYFISTAFKVELGTETQKVRRRILEGLCRTIGDKPFARIETRHVQAWMDARADRPEAANGLLKALRGLFAFAIARGIAKHNPVEKIKKLRVRTDGFHTWTADEVHIFEARHPVGTVPRLAMALLLYTGQRRGDIVGIGRQHVQEGRLRIRQGKTRAVVFLPILPQLHAVLDATPLGTLSFIVNKFGQPFTAAGFGGAFRQWCDRAGLPHCTAHGLRKAGATIAAENGATDRELMAIFGWKKAEMATLYTAQAEQKRLAKSGMGKLVHGTSDEPPKSHLQNGGTEVAKKVGKING